MNGDLITVSVSHGGALIINGQETATHLSRQQAHFLRLVLSARGVLTREFALASLYPVEADEPQLKIFDVLASHVRSRLGPEHRGAFETIWGRGWLRNRAYCWIDPDPDTITMPVNMHWLGELAMHLDKPPEVVLDDILKQAFDQIVQGIDP